MLEWIAQLSNGWALAVNMEPQWERGTIAAYKNSNSHQSFGFAFHPKKKGFLYKLGRTTYVKPYCGDMDGFDKDYRSMNEAIKLAYDYVLEQLEEEKIAAEKEQAAREVLEEAKVAGKMFQMADKALQKCLAGDKK